jgi:hypothetical protein
VSSQQKADLDALLRKLPLDFGGDLAEQRPLTQELMTSHPLPADVTTSSRRQPGVEPLRARAGPGGWRRRAGGW